MIKAVFFDFYYTLGVWGLPLEESLQKIADRYQFEIDWKRYAFAVQNLFADASDTDPSTHSILETMDTIVKSYCEFIRQLGVREHADQMAWELLQAGHSLFAANVASLYNDTIPTLEQLHKDGYKLAIVSNWDTPLDPLLERLGIAKYFDVITASHDTRVRSAKPDPHIFNYTLNAVGVTPEETVHVGDTFEADIIGAQGVGIRPILIDREGSQQGRWHETIRSLAELPDLLKVSQ
ncbi:HAD-IA family hydrolase [Candidatus Poribacteria bacterium]|nr:HAD-IA family hydrolase [Candidatus Poribacteria bacterium]